MGKNKKPRKTKEVSVAIAEASSTGDLETRQQSQTPRKRGRPRKIIEKGESVVKKEESTAEGAQATHEQENSTHQEIRELCASRQHKWTSSYCVGSSSAQLKMRVRPASTAPPCKFSPW
ncbi:hypothetical protein SADUNF_Sadunf02G0206700 [Salix dunnii]|uniref:Uncharacterized protein n=1 Tax=Salix dunnii TaxID=1413687 RepID=A0A835TIF4_9ROSI|nr:hypothetical protein SADUNF_Sadunf02G0206700 [Salix dunnii]